MKILLIGSSNEEIAGTISFLEKDWEKVSFWEYKKDDVSIYPMVTGTGSVFMAFGLSRFPEIKNIDYVINPGFGAGISRTLDLGRVYLIKEEEFGDIGLEEADGTFNNLHELKWQDPNKFPFLKGKLYPKSLINPSFLPTCSAMTVNKIPGTPKNIAVIEKKYHADMMSLDGAACMYACRMMDLELIQFRVNIRNVESWQIKNSMISQYAEQLYFRTNDVIKNLSQSGIY